MVAETLHGVITGMTQTTMPDVEGDSDDVVFGWWWWTYGVEWSGAIASKNRGPSRKCLHRKTPRVKLNINIIISCELTNREKILDYVRNNEDMI